MLAGASVRVGVARGPDWAACAGAEPAVIVTAAVAPAPTSPDKTSVAVSGRQRPSRRPCRDACLRACRGARPGAPVASGTGTGGTGTGGTGTGGTGTGGTGAGTPGGVAVVIVSGAATCARVTGSGSQPAAG